MSAKQRMILGVTREAAERVFNFNGVMALGHTEALEQLTELNPDAVVMRRELLETDLNFRHPIPYLVITRNNSVTKDKEVFVYQRTKLVGEQRLGNKFSIGLGGHVELEQIFFGLGTQIVVKDAIMATAIAEINEEVSFDGLSFQAFTMEPHRVIRGPEITGIVMDSSDAVGRQHLGVVFILELCDSPEVKCIEPELTTVGFVSLEKLLAEDSPYDFENWTKLILEQAYELLA